MGGCVGWGYNEKGRLWSVNLDEASCRVTPLLKMLLPVLLLDFEGKPRTQDTLQGDRKVKPELEFTSINLFHPLSSRRKVCAHLRSFIAQASFKRINLHICLKSF